MTDTYDTISEEHGYRLCRRGDGRYTVVRVDYDKNQVYNAMPGDAPDDGGWWCARLSDFGITYVSSGYSENYARRIYRGLVEEARELSEVLG